MIRRVILFAGILFAVVLSVLLVFSTAEYAFDTAAAEETTPGAKENTAAKKVPQEFKQAGVCARCHVVSVLEWSISGHVEAATNCQKCHGPSRGHVANERNEVKPDRRPRGEAIAKQLCSTCHETGCPETLQVQNCQKCHHVHALINPAKPPAAKDNRLAKLLARWQQFQKHMAEGDQHVKQRDWKAGQAAFRTALDLIPGNHLARTRLEMCTRRLEPGLPGFKIVGDKFDPETGLAYQVGVADLNIEMLLVAPGEFDMGSDDLVDSRPAHTVRVDAFYLGQYEVTQAQWQAIMGNNPSAHQGDGFPNAERMPAERVSWNDCQEFLKQLNVRVPGGGFRLPTEAEWEYASRGAAITTEKRQLSQIAWYRGNSLRKATPDKAFLEISDFAPRPAGQRRPNAAGFYDMQGNVGEWCSSLFRPYLYNPTDGRESLTEKGMRVLRGGGFADSADSLDPAARHAERPHRRFRWNGLRLARSVPELPLNAASKKSK